MRCLGVRTPVHAARIERQGARLFTRAAAASEAPRLWDAGARRPGLAGAGGWAAGARGWAIGLRERVGLREGKARAQVVVAGLREAEGPRGSAVGRREVSVGQGEEYEAGWAWLNLKGTWHINIVSGQAVIPLQVCRLSTGVGR